MRKIVKYIKFRLPTGGGGLPANMHKNKIANSVRSWAQPRNIPVSFETEGYTFNVYFETEAEIAQFMLSYEPEYGKPSVVSY